MANPAISIWCNGPNDRFAVGQYGVIFHYDGATFSEMTDTKPFYFEGAWCSSPNNAFLVGYYAWTFQEGGEIWTISSPIIARYDGASIIEDDLRGLELGTSSMNAVWGSGPNDVFAVGGFGRILHYDGVDPNWKEMDSGTAVDLFGVWGSSPNDVFAVGGSVYGTNGTILHYDGSSWSVMASGLARRLEGVWGTGADDVFAVGDHGTILHYDGLAWSEMTSGTTENLLAVWGSGPNDIFAVGGCEGIPPAGTILHYNGSTWSAMSSGTTDQLHGVWGSGPNDVFAVGIHGRVLHFNGSVWSAMESGTSNMLTCVVGSGTDSVYAVGTGTTVLRPRRCSLSVSIVSHPEWGHVVVEPNLPWYRAYERVPVTLTATVTQEGKMWMGWEGDVDPNDRYTNPLTVIMDRDKTITTSFKCGMGLGPMLPLMAIGLIALRAVRWR